MTTNTCPSSSFLLYVDSFHSIIPDAIIESRPRPRFNTRGLHLELLRSPSVWMRVYYRLWPFLVLAHVPIQTFFDFNTAYMLIQCVSSSFVIVLYFSPSPNSSYHLIQSIRPVRLLTKNPWQSKQVPSPDRLPIVCEELGLGCSSIRRSLVHMDNRHLPRLRDHLLFRPSMARP